MPIKPIIRQDRNLNFFFEVDKMVLQYQLRLQKSKNVFGKVRSTLPPPPPPPPPLVCLRLLMMTIQMPVMLAIKYECQQ